MTTLNEYNRRYEEIMSQPSLSRDKQLSRLMTEMERKYKIPLLQTPEWESNNRKVIALYRKISMSRDL
jgi:hypothetical protein